MTYVPGNDTNKTTGLVSAYQNGSDDAYTYTYDDNGNITEITQGTTSITYEYDTANRLTRENNQVTNETVTYEYDVWGNILNRKVYAYTVGDLTNVPYTEIEYEYTNTAWGDQLTSYDNTAITYDGMGNPLTYRGYTFGWRGKQLTSASSGTDSLTFEYNEDGLRQKKTVNNVDTDYFYNGSVLIGMQQNNDVLRFSYDASGNVVSVDFNGTEYYYLRNAQGDIVKLIDASGATVVEYTYDTWGKKVATTGTLAGTLGLFQPFRYRGYVYDEETGFYYLQSRYYDPTTGRFISADVLLSTGQGVLGHNAYAYCLDNPVNMVDDGGSSARDLGLISERGGGVAVDNSQIPRYYEYGEEEQALTAFYHGYTVYYRDTKLVWVDRPFKSSCTFLGKIHIHKGQNFNSTDLKHEYGHIVQEKLLGPLKYALCIALPSAVNCDKFTNDERGYYSQKWEHSADLFGGVNIGERKYGYVDGAKEKAIKYFLKLLFFF